MLRKFLIGGAVFLVLLVGAAFAIPFFFKDKINARVKEEINKNLLAKVDYSGFDVTIIPSFPNLTFKLDKFSIIGNEPFKGDTLVYIDQFGITLDIMTVINNQKYKILALTLDKPVINGIVNREGKANWDIMKPTTGSQKESSQNFALEIKKYKINEGNITYSDEKGNAFYKLIGLDFEGKGDVTQDIYKLVTNTSIASLSAKNAGVGYLNNVKLTAENEIEVDNKNHKYSFANNEINLNDLTLLFDGYVKMNEANNMLDIKFKSKEASFKSILSMIPAIYQKDFDKIKTEGTLKLDGFVKGLQSDKIYPGIDLNLVVGNAMFQYPSLPMAVTGINVDAHIAKPQGDLDLTQIDIKKLHANIGADPIDVVAFIKHPISDPNIKASVNGKLNLANVPKFYPLEGVKQINGLLTANVNLNTKMSDIEKKNYQAIQASGTAKVTNMLYDSKDVPKAINLKDLQLTFNPQNVQLNNLEAKIGRSDFKANGSLDNFIGYLFNKGALVGKLNNTSALFDANEWLGIDPNAAPSNSTTAKTSTTANKNDYFKVPTNIEFNTTSSFGTVIYDKINLTNVKGNVVMKDESIYLNDIFAQLLGGNATISAVYATPGGSKPKVNFTYDINNFDFAQTFKTVGMAEKVAPIMKYVVGNFSSDLKGQGALNPDMSLDYNSLTGNGKIEIPNAKIVNMPMIQKIVEVAKIPALNNLEMKNAWTVLKFENGKVAVEPTDIKFGNGYNINLGGKNGFDQTIDYDIRFDVPSKELGPYANNLIGMIPKIPGVPISMPETINLFLKVGGTASKPTVKLNKVGGAGSSVKDMATNVANDLKAKAEAEAKAKAEELKAKAQQEADKIKQQAEQQIKQQTNQIKKDAEDKVKDAIKGIKLPW